MIKTPPQIVHLSTLHPRNELRTFLKECRTLRDAGYDVAQVVADGEGDEFRDNITVYDVGTAPNRIVRMAVLPLQAFRRIRRLAPRLVHFHDPELLLVAYALHLSGIHVIYDAHEDLPRAVLSKKWIHPVMRKAVAWATERIENFVAARIDAVVAATPHIAQRFAKVTRYSIAVSNYPLKSELADDLSHEREARTFCYAGNITRHRGVVEMVQATARAGARLILAGPIERGIESELNTMPEWVAIDYHGIVDREEVQKMMARSVGGLLFYHPEPNHVNALPNKMFEYMSAGLPVLCSNFEFWQTIIEREGVGLSASPFDPDAIAAQMLRILSDPAAAQAMGRRGYRLVQSRYTWEAEAVKLLALYRNILGS